MNLYPSPPSHLVGNRCHGKPVAARNQHTSLWHVGAGKKGLKTAGLDLCEHSVAIASIYMLSFHVNWKAAAAVAHETPVAGGAAGSGGGSPTPVSGGRSLWVPLQRVRSAMSSC